jgi:hypothetical protein
MRILIFDKYNYPRDLAQMDMYYALSEVYETIFATPENLIDLITEDQYDYLYLGIYHPWCGKINWDLVFSLNKKPIIIDQADNEGFLARKISKFNYGENSILLSRYLPNERLRKFWKGKLCLLPWYINPERFIPREKQIDISFVCMININRLGADRKKMSEDILKYSEDNKLIHKIGQYWGENYSNVITSSRAMVIDGSRYCVTQKYIEAALSKCLIIGQKPTSPENDFITISLDSYNKFTDYQEIIDHNRKYVLDTFANKQKFLETFNDIIKKAT